MSGPAVLEQRYRHWLGLFPAGHRAVHGEEMLGVLMAGAPAGQQWPRLADAADLAWGALKIRLRTSPAAPWSDALAVVSVVLPLITAVNFAASSGGVLAGLPPGSRPGTAESLGILLAAMVLVLSLALLRLRRTAVLVVVVLLAVVVWDFSTSGQVSETVIDPQGALPLLLLALEAVALAGSPGPRRGLQLLRAPQYAFAVAVAAASGLVGSLMTGLAARRATELAAVAVTVAGMVIVAPLSRRIAALLSLPLYYWALNEAVPQSRVPFDGGMGPGWAGPLRVSLACVPMAVLGCTALTAGMRARARRARPS